MTELEQKRVDVAKGALELVRNLQWTPIRDLGDDNSGCVLGALSCACHRELKRSASDTFGDRATRSLIGAYEGHWPHERWMNAIPDDRDRQIAILQNIIRNNGTFHPDDIRPIEQPSPALSLDFKHEPRPVVTVTLKI